MLCVILWYELKHPRQGAAVRSTGLLDGVLEFVTACLFLGTSSSDLMRGFAFSGLTLSSW